MPELLAELPSYNEQSTPPIERLYELPSLDEAQGSVPSHPLAYEAEIAEQPRLTMRQRFAASRAGKALFGSLISAGLISGGVVATAAPAHANSNHTYTIENTGGEGVWLHDDPGLGDQDDLMAVIPEGARVTAECYVQDTPVGPKGNPAWLHITHEGSQGFISDYFTSSRWTKNNTLRDQGLKLCEEEKDAPEILNPNFDRMSGVRWAIANARQPQENGAQCTWFVSNALWQAGLPKTKEWTDEGGYWSQLRRFDGTVTAHAAANLVEYLQNNFSVTRHDIDNLGNHDIPLAQVGDVIAYDWKGDGRIDHLAFVTGHSKDNPNYPLVAEWGQFNWDDLAMFKNNISNPKSSYDERGWNWSEMNNKWLVEGYPDATAHVLHINGGYKAPEF